MTGDWKRLCVPAVGKGCGGAIRERRPITPLLRRSRLALGNRGRRAAARSRRISHVIADSYSLLSGCRVAALTPLEEAMGGAPRSMPLVAAALERSSDLAIVLGVSCLRE